MKNSAPKRRRPSLSRESILFGLGLAIIIFEVINSEVLGRNFHVEFLLAGLALCGVSITQLGDHK